MALNRNFLLTILLFTTVIVSVIEAVYPSARKFKQFFTIHTRFCVFCNFAGEIERPRAICRLPKAIGLCKASILRWRYNPETGKCEEFIYGGCGGNANNFEEEEYCRAACSMRFECNGCFFFRRLRSQSKRNYLQAVPLHTTLI